MSDLSPGPFMPEPVPTDLDGLGDDPTAAGVESGAQTSDPPKGNTMTDPTDFTTRNSDDDTDSGRDDAATEAREDVNDAFDTQEPGVAPEPLTESTDGGLDGSDPGVEE